MTISNVFSRKAVRAATFVAAVALGGVVANGAAMASTISINLNGSGSSTVLPGPLDFTIGGSAQSGFFGNTLNINTALNNATPVTGSQGFLFGGSPNTWDFDFSLGNHFSPSKASSFNVTLTASSFSGSLTGSDFELVDLSHTGSHGSLDVVATSTTVKGHSNELNLVANLPASSRSDLYEIVVKLSGSNAAFSATGSVPVPGALVLFVTALTGLGLFGMRSRRLGRMVG